MSKPKKLEAKVYQHSKNQILTRQWLPQTHITEIGLAKELGISRTPIRQAFLRLEKEGYIVIEPNKGIRIQEKKISLQEFHEQLDFMELVLIDHLHFLQIKEIQFDTDALENTIDQINRVADGKDLDVFLTIEFDYMRGLFRYAKNSYATSLFLDTFRNIKEQNNEEITDYLQLIQSTKVKHFNQIVLFLKNNDYPLARKEVRILVNQLSLIAIQGI